MPERRSTEPTYCTTADPAVAVAVYDDLHGLVGVLTCQIVFTSVFFKTPDSGGTMNESMLPLGVGLNTVIGTFVIRLMNWIDVELVGVSDCCGHPAFVLSEGNGALSVIGNGMPAIVTVAVR